MLGLSIGHVGVYRDAEKHRQAVHVPWLGFYRSGIIYFQIILPSGQVLRELTEVSEPCFFLGVPGMVMNFEVDDQRENWVIMFDDLQMGYADDFSHAVVLDRETWVPLPFFVDVPRLEADGWVAQLEQIQAAHRDPTPTNQLKARLGVLNIYRHFLEQDTPRYAGSPAAHLKALLDDNNNFGRNVTELSQACGYSVDHLRLLFEKQYQVNPLTYRQERRKAYVMQLIAQSNLTVAEIAHRAGFKYPSHFSLDFKKIHGISPREAIQKYRYRL